MTQRPRAGVWYFQDKWIFAFLSLGTFISRLPYRSHEIFHTDSLGLSLGAIYTWTAHPPGFIGYNALGRLFYVFVGDINTSFVLLNITCTSLMVGVIFLLGKSLFGRRVGVLSALVAGTSVLTLYFSDIALTYAAEGFFATVFGYCSWQAIRKRDWRWLLVSSLALAAGGAVRQTTLAFLFPLWVLTAFAATGSWAKRALGAALLILVVSAWAVPNAHFLEKYWEKGERGYLAGMYKLQVAMEQYYDGGTVLGPPETYTKEPRYHWPFVEFAIVLYNLVSPPDSEAGSEIRNASFDHAFRLTAYQAFKLCLYGTIALGLASLSVLAVLCREIRKKILRDRQRLIFFGLWIVPAAGFFVVGHLGSWGYLLIFFSPLAIGCVRLLVELPKVFGEYRLLRPPVVVSAAMGCSLLFFFLAGPLPETSFRNNLLNIAVFQYTKSAIGQGFARARAGLEKDDPRQLPLDCLTNDCLVRDLPRYFHLEGMVEPARPWFKRGKK